MEPANENQIEKINTELNKFRHRLKFYNHIFTTDIIPKPKIIKEEFEVISQLIRYEKSALIFIANEIECNYRPTSHDTKKFSSFLLRYINIPLLIITLVFIGIILYRDHHRCSGYMLIVLWSTILFIVSLVVAKFLNVISEFKDRQCVYLLRQAITLKEKNVNDKGLQILFESMGNLMIEARNQKIRGERLITLLKEVLTQKEKNT